MAVLQQQNVMGGEEELKKKQQNLAQPQTFGGQSVQAGGATVPGQQTPGSGRFVNLQKYLSASGPNAGGQIATKLSGKAQEKTGQAQEATTEADSIRQAVQATQTKYQGAGQPLKSEISNYAQGSGDLGQQSQDQIKNLLSRGYAGEAQKLQEQFNPLAAQAATKTGAAQQYVQDLGSEKGRYGLLQEAYRRPQYGAGQQRLDQLLLQQQQGVGGGLTQMQKQLQQGLAGTQKTLADVQNVTGEDFNKIITAGQQSQKDVQDALTGGISGIEKSLEEKAMGRTAESTKAITDLQAQLAAAGEGDVNISQELAQQLGLTNSSYDIYNLFKEGTQPQARQFNAQDVIDENTLHKYKTLGSFLGDGTASRFDKAAAPQSLVANEQFLKELAGTGGKFQEAAKNVIKGTAGYNGSTANLGSSVEEYLANNKDLSKTLYGMSSEDLWNKAWSDREEAIARARIESSQRQRTGLRPLSPEEINQSLAAEKARFISGQGDHTSLLQQKAQILGAKGYAQDFSGSNQGDWNILNSSQERSLQKRLEEALTGLGYGRRLVVGPSEASKSGPKNLGGESFQG